MPFAGERNTTVSRATGHETKATTDERLGLSARTQRQMPKTQGSRLRPGDEGMPAVRAFPLRQSGEKQADTAKTDNA